jgi:hypothetical protein
MIRRSPRSRSRPSWRLALAITAAPKSCTAPARDAIDVLRAGTKERPLARTKELREPVGLSQRCQ